jgi:hypothetical protein
MNNEPVAWMGIRRHGEIRVSVQKLDKDDIPLYTHPVKELTDEDILDTFDPHFDADIEDKELIKFARAILRKAQEK